MITNSLFGTIHFPASTGIGQTSVLSMMKPAAQFSHFVDTRTGSFYTPPSPMLGISGGWTYSPENPAARASSNRPQINQSGMIG